MNDQGVQSCNFCGYLFENFSTPTISATENVKPEPAAVNPLNTVAPPSFQETSASSYPPASISNGTPLFVVTKSLIASMAPGIAYLVFIVVINSYTAINLFSLLLIAFFVLLSVVPVLFSPRRFEFFDDSLRIHKIIRGDSEFRYSDLRMYDSPMRRRNQIALSAVGQRRPIVIQGNPTNKELGIDLKQFLSSKLKKPETAEKTNQQESPNDEDFTANSDNAT